MIEWLSDGMAYRDDVEEHIHLLTDRGLLSREAAEAYLVRISDLLDTGHIITLPPAESYTPCTPEVNPLAWMDVLFPRKHPNEPPETKKGQIRDMVKVPFINYLQEAGYVKTDDGQFKGWYHDNGRYMEIVEPSDVEDEIARAATACMMDLPSRSWAATTITQAG